MAQRASGRADRSGGADPFPWVVSLGCLLVGVALFIHSTMPALAENRALRALEDEQIQEVERVRTEHTDVEAKQSRLARDPESLRVEFDRHGLSPQQAIELDPARDRRSELSISVETAVIRRMEGPFRSSDANRAAGAPPA